MTTLQSLLGYLMIFLAGFVSAINLCVLYPNPNYDASWGKVLVSVFLAIAGAYISKMQPLSNQNKSTKCTK